MSARRSKRGSTDEREYTPIVIGGTVYLPVHLQARRDADIPADPDEIPDSITVRYHQSGRRAGLQVIDFSELGD